MLQISRIQHPSPDQYHRASRVCEEVWEHLGRLNHNKRCPAFQRMGVELVLAQDEHGIQGVCFVLPDAYVSPQGEQPFVWLFQWVSKPEARNAGAMMLLRMMEWYPAMMCIGVTEQAGAVYRALRWKQYDAVWRCVHPIDPGRMLEKHVAGTVRRRERVLYSTLGGVYRLAMRFLESMVRPNGAEEAFRSTCSGTEEAVRPAAGLPRLRMVATYLPVLRMRCNTGILDVVEFCGMGRVVHDTCCGWRRLWAHAGVWKALRRRGADLVEMVAVSKKARRAAMLSGYIPIRMPVYFWDKEDRLSHFFENLADSEFNFSHCDKIL